MIRIETIGVAPESVRLDRIREGLNRANVHLAGELHSPQEFNQRSGSYSVSRSRLLVAPRNRTAENLVEMSLFADEILKDQEGVYRWNQDAKKYNSSFGPRLMFGKIYAAELIETQEEDGKRIGEHSRSIEVIVMPDPVLSDVVFAISQEKLGGAFNPRDPELLLATESLPYGVFQAGTGSLREHVVGLAYALEQHRQAVHGQV